MHKIFSEVWNWYPPVGVFIAILAVVGVLVPFFRDLATMGKKEKAVWTIVMFALVLLEIRSIYLERNAHDKEQTEARSEQLRQFNKIATGIDTTITDNKNQFTAEMERLENTLSTSKQTLKNTQPYASLEFEGAAPYRLRTTTKNEFPFNITLANTGIDTAKDTKYDGRIYVGKLDDIESEKNISSAFDEWWKTSKHAEDAAIEAHDQRFFSITPTFNDNEVKGILDHTLTFYLLVRFTWTDGTGRWITDFCIGYQDPTHDFEVGHPCDYHNKHRYRDALPK